ncbi:hypothetical protein [Microvirga tunisiensis]|uniref:Uncharacterized protein n=1 Tax=Microvirga tunisiensis TaxID=2108360 RepID=A0A5N7MX93_9HYPH|nr:hypothetical protein [Microvirga tunisiensis]MPR13677.1 hypothetical protein [Microvirga tunisiensis]MPR31518.1 hypothetical protein [Microvirga tunisiensis]
MPYRLIQLAPGSYDLLLHGEIIGSIVRSGSRTGQVTWTAELLNDPAPGPCPPPFTQVEHTFMSLEEVCVWLAGPEIKPLRRTE